MLKKKHKQSLLSNKKLTVKNSKKVKQKNRMMDNQLPLEMVEELKNTSGLKLLR